MSTDWHDGYCTKGEYGIDAPCDCGWEDALVTIRSQARAVVLRELREEVAGMMYWFGPYYPDGIDHPAVDIETVDRSAVLAAIDRRLGDD